MQKLCSLFICVAILGEEKETNMKTVLSLICGLIYPLLVTGDAVRLIHLELLPLPLPSFDI